jgi:hypothetical protein
MEEENERADKEIRNSFCRDEERISCTRFSLRQLPAYSLVQLQFHADIIGIILIPIYQHPDGFL